MRLRSFGVLLVLATAPVVVGCGPSGRMSFAPAPTTIATAANTGATATRLAFAVERYRAPIFPSVSSTVATYATGLPSLDGSPSTPLALTIYQPLNDALAARPLIVWIHGGAFTSGVRGEMEGTAIQYAQLGYVTASIDYRLDPGSNCLLLQWGFYSGTPQYATEYARCQRAFLTARDDAAAAIAWLRANAATYGIDTTRVAVGGASAGAITAIHVGETMNTPGNPPPAASRVSAVLAMSGCNYLDGSVDTADAPIAMLASGSDFLVPFACVTATADAAQAQGTAVLRNYYPNEGLHAQILYAAHQPEVDRAWRLFLIGALGLA